MADDTSYRYTLPPVWGEDDTWAAPEEKLRRCRMALITRSPFFGSLVFGLRFASSPFVKTVETNGKIIRYNPRFVRECDEKYLTTILAHECAHISALHFERRGGRDINLWNEACDYSINPDLLSSGYALPPGALYNNKFQNASAEEIYTYLEARQKASQQGEGNGGASMGGGGEPNDQGAGKQTGGSESAEPQKDKSEPAQKPQNNDAQAKGEQGGGTGADGNNDAQAEDEGAGGPEQGQGDEEPYDEPLPGDTRQTIEYLASPGVGDFGGMGAIVDGHLDEADRAEIKVAIAQAIAAAGRSKENLPSVKRAAQAIASRETDWRAILQDHISRTRRTDVSWNRPNRRHIWRGQILPLPGITVDAHGAIEVFIDVSTSMSWPHIRAALNEIASIRDEINPDRVIITQWNTHRCSRLVIEKDDDFSALKINVGGGTDFHYAFKELDPEAEAIIVLTDLGFDGEFPADPGVPTLWCIWGYDNVSADLLPKTPYGTVVKLRLPSKN